MTPDGQLAVSAGADATVRLWDLATGACLQTLLGHEGRVTAVAMTPDGRLAVSAGADATVRLWDLATGACLQTLSGHQQEVKALAMTPDGRRAVSGGQDAVLRVWDLGAGGCLHALQGHTEYISVVDLTPDGQKAVSGGYDASIRIWDLERGRCLKVFHGHTDTVISLSLTPDGARAISATAADDPTIRLWDIETGQSEPTPHHYHGNVWSVALSPEGSIAVSVDDCLRVWDASTGQSLQILETSLGIHPDSTVALTPDGRLIVFADERNIRLWDLSTGQCIRTLPGEGGRIRSLTLTPDGRWAITAEEARENLLSLWDLASGTRVKAVNCPDESIVGLWVSPDGRLVISKSQRQRYRVWDIQSGQWVKTYEAAQENGAPIDGAELRILLEHRGKMETLHQGPVKEPVTLPDRRLGLLNDDQALRMLNMETGQCVAAVDLLSTVFSFATNGNVVVVGDRFGAVHFFRILNRAGYIPRTTVLRLYLFGKSGWDAHLRSICPWCCQRFVPEAGKLETIRCITARLSSGQSPLLALTGDVFDEPGLLSSCPHCHASLRFNPFIVDNS
jgi:WD40 repeat protein